MLSKIKQAAALSAAAAASQEPTTRPAFVNNSTNNNNNTASPHSSSSSAASTNQANSDNEDNNNNINTGSTSTSSNNNNHTNTNNNNNNNAEIDQNDSNNNNQSNLDNNNHQSISSSKKTQDELIDIVEVSRKRRLSKDSADSLSSFIRWSFSHLDQHNQRRAGLYSQKLQIIEQNNNTLKSHDHREATPPPAVGDDQKQQQIEDDDHWAALNLLNSVQQQRHRQLAIGSPCGGSSAANLALVRDRSTSSSDLLALGRPLHNGNKRPRMQMYSPETKMFSSSTSSAGAVSPRKGYLGNVVERLHQQQQLQQQQLHHQQQQQEAMDQRQQQQQQQTEGPNPGLSYHLQQFLSQQTSLEDLCSSVGLDDSNQLVLAAAIHRALVDSVNPSTQADSAAKSTASSVGGSSASSSGPTTMNKSGANLHLIDSLARQQSQRATTRSYNTRAALHGLQAVAAAAAAQQEQQEKQRAAASGGGASAAAAAMAAMSGINQQQRAQQQRHAQAAAALSALASAGSNHHHLSNGSNHGTNHHQQSNHNHHPLDHTLGLAHVSAAGANGQLATSGHQATGNAQAPNGGGPIIDFECDTCGSSFDDRHRLMQHQSIHLELKKDWFTETPVDEVMKIFNRRRGEFLCNTCNLRFEATFDYDKHNHQVHGQRPYCCQFCGNGTRTFRFWRQYLNHLYDHRYIFSCTIDDCDFTVNRRDSLRFHIFRFHLNCQLPQQQTTIRSAGQHHHHNLLLGAGDLGATSNKWPSAMMDHEQEDEDEDDDQDQDQDQDDIEMNVGE